MRVWQVILWLLMGAMRLPAQNTDILFHHFKEKDGLSNNFITSFLRDSRGNLWMGSINGLNRFDGSHFYSFLRSRSSKTIIDNIVLDLCEDKQGNIWGATTNGIFRYSIVADTFKNYKTPSTRFAKVIKNIHCDTKGRIWATGEWNIMRFDEKSDAFTDLPPLAPAKDSMHYYAIYQNGLMEDPSGNGLWFASRRGLHYYDTEKQRFENYKNSTHDVFTAEPHNLIHKAYNNQYWTYNRTKGELIVFNPASKTIAQRYSLPDSIGKPYISCLFVDRQNRVWFSTWNQGIYLFEPTSGNRFSKIAHDVTNPYTIAGDFMWAMMQDQDGTLWFGTSGGLSLANPEKSLFSLHRISSIIPAFVNIPINLVKEDPYNKTWWILFNGSHAANYNPVTGAVDTFSLQRAAPKQPGYVHHTMYEIRFFNDTILFSTQGGALYKTRSDQRLRIYDPLHLNSKDNIVRDVLKYKDSISYLQLYSKIYVWHIGSQALKEIKPSLDTLPNGQRPVFDYLFLGPNGKLWFVAGFGWIGSADPEGKVRYYKMQDKSKLDYNGYYTSISIDRDGRLWLSNKGAGLDCFDTRTEEVTSYFQSDGLVSDDMTTVTPDGQGRIWATAVNRFSVFKPGGNKYYNFQVPINEGLFNFSSYSSYTSDGKVLVSISNAIAAFNPSYTDAVPAALPISISAIKVNGRTIFLNDLKEIKLEPNENNLNIFFGMLVDSKVFPHQFYYRLSGIDDSMKLVSNQAEAVYTNLPPGSYTFFVKAVSETGVWTSPEVKLKITIRTPILKSRFFYFTIAVSILAMLFGVYRYRLKQKERYLQLQSKTQELEKEKALVMYENLKQHLNPHFLFNSLTSLSSLIRIDQHMAGDFLDKMSKVYRYILKNRDNEVVPLSEELKFVQLYIDLQKTRFNDGLQVKVQIGDEFLHRKIAPVTLQNLVENAIKHNTADEDSPLIIELLIEDDCMVVRNNLQKKKFVETSNRQGLANMESLYRYLSKIPMQIIENQTHFIVKIPLI